MIGVATLLLVGLVGAAVWWQVGAHASPAQVSVTVLSAAGDPYTLASGATGISVNPINNAGCFGVDSNGICTDGGWPRYMQPAIPGAQWIWPTTQWDPVTQGTNPVTFTKQFTLTEGAHFITGHIQISADNAYDLQVNGQEVGSGHNWTHPDTYDVSSLLRGGSNTITAEATNDPSANPSDPPSSNPAGLIFRADVSYTPDNTAPTTTATVAGNIGSNGWYRGPVTLTLQATDPDDASSTLQTNYSLDGGSTWLAYTAPVTISDDGQHNLKFYSIDQATNPETAQPMTINIDQTPPDLHVTGAANQTFDACASARPVRPTYAPTDATSGLDGSQAETWTTPSTATGAGVYTYTAKATDLAGNQATDSRTYSVLYGTAVGSLLDPFKANQTNSFNLGSTIPLKFQIMCNGTPLTTVVASLSVKQGSGTAATPAPKKLSTANTFVYNATDQAYHLNVATGSGYTNPDGTPVTFGSGTWTFTVNLDDGTSRDYTLQLS